MRLRPEEKLASDVAQLSELPGRDMLKMWFGQQRSDDSRPQAAVTSQAE